LWSREDEKYLLAHAGERAFDLAKKLGRTMRAVRHKRREVLAKYAPKTQPVGEITEFLMRTSVRIKHITVSVQAPKLVVFCPSDTTLSAIEAKFGEEGLPGSLFVNWMMQTKDRRWKLEVASAEDA
jgi:hypothetical protein